MRAPILLLAGAVSAALDRGSIESQPYFVVRAQSDGCLVECDDSFPNGTASFACYAFTDGVQHGFEAAGLAPGSTCMNVTFESPDEAPGTEDPEMKRMTVTKDMLDKYVYNRMKYSSRTA